MDSFLDPKTFHFNTGVAFSKWYIYVCKSMEWKGILVASLVHKQCVVYTLFYIVYILYLSIWLDRIERCLEDKLKPYSSKVSSNNAFIYRMPALADHKDKYFLPYIGGWDIVAIVYRYKKLYSVNVLFIIQSIKSMLFIIICICLSNGWFCTRC